MFSALRGSNRFARAFQHSSHDGERSRRHDIPFVYIGSIDRLVDRCKGMSLSWKGAALSLCQFQHHKLNDDLALHEVVGDENRRRALLDKIVVSAVAMKNVAS